MARPQRKRTPHLAAVVPFPRRHSHDDVVHMLYGLLKKALDGQIDGMMFACDQGGTPELGMTGSYARDLMRAMGVASRLNRQLHVYYDDQLER